MIAAVAALLLHGGYPTMDAAARDALIAAAHCSHRYECGGAIYESGGRYYWSGPESDARPFGVTIHEYERPIPGMPIVADYHTHICEGRHFWGFFSPGDVAVNDGFHTVGYMLSLCDGNIHRYAPGVDDREDEEVDYASGRKMYLTIGHLAGWVSPQLMNGRPVGEPFPDPDYEDMAGSALP